MQYSWQLVALKIFLDSPLPFWLSAFFLCLALLPNEVLTYSYTCNGAQGYALNLTNSGASLETGKLKLNLMDVNKTSFVAYINLNWYTRMLLEMKNSQKYSKDKWLMYRLV